jgi:AraC family transcriptional regulator
VDPELRFSEVEFRPKLFFFDRDIWETALKLKTQVDTPASSGYAEALGAVLTHELVRQFTRDRHGRPTARRSPISSFSSLSTSSVPGYSISGAAASNPGSNV